MNIDENELVMFKSDKNDVIQSGGYKINNILKKYNTPIMNSLNTNSLNNSHSDKDKKDKVSQIYNDLAVPAGLLYLQDMSKQILHNNDTVSNMNNLNKNSINLNNINMNDIKYSKNEVIDDSLYDKLFKLASTTMSNTIDMRNKTKSKNKIKDNIKDKNAKTYKNKSIEPLNIKLNVKEKINNKRTKRVRFSKYNKTKRFYK